MGASVAVFIGDEISAAGYRLCGVDVQVTDGGNALSLVRRACERAPLVLISSSAARNIHSEDLDDLMAGIHPCVLVVPDVRGLHEVPDVVSRIRAQLGMME